MDMLLLFAALTVFQVDPWHHEPYLPNADPKGIEPTQTVRFAAARGETEAFSVVVRPGVDLKRVNVVASELKGPGGAVITPSAADVQLVKVWFRPGGRWTTSWCGALGDPQPIPTLVLHDDALVAVDFEKKTNRLRADYPDGPVYLDISHRDKKTDFEHDLEPIHDAPRFVPFDLKKDRRQQYLVTWKIPRDAKAGRYTGTLAFAPEDAVKESVSVELDVHPFVLPRPRTHYDTSKPYVSYWMGSPNLENLLAGSRRLDRAEAKCRAIFRSLREHNAINVSGVGTFKDASTDDLAVRTMIIARQEGLCCDGLINGAAFAQQGAFVWNPGGKLRSAEDAPEEYAQTLEDFRKRVSVQQTAMDLYLGHHRDYFCSGDECGTYFHRRSFGFWNIIHELGGETWSDYGVSRDIGWIVGMNDIPASICHHRAWDWRQGGAKSVTYAGTFTGPESPAIWRRTKGIRYWYADFDGLHEYDFFDGRANRWNDFVWRGRYCQFGIVYWTDVGLVSTLAWEAVREAMDDVSYYSLLRLRAEAALKSEDPEVRRLGREAIVWQDSKDPEYVADLDRFRLETSEWIVRLMAAVGPEPEERETEKPAPALPPHSLDGKCPQNTEGRLAFAVRCERINRYDLALKALDAVRLDASAPVGPRVRAALKAAELHRAIRERAAALAALDGALKLRGIERFDRGSLLLSRVRTQLADAKFEETRDRSDVDVVSEDLEKALKHGGGSDEERGEAIRLTAQAYLTAQAWPEAIAFAKRQLKLTGIPSDVRVTLHVATADAQIGEKKWQAACRSFDRARKESGECLNRDCGRDVLPREAWAAEQCKDWLRAQRCYQDLARCYDKVDEPDMIKSANANAARVSKLLRESTSAKDDLHLDGDSEELSLEE